MLAVVISVLGGVLNVRLPGRISTSGPASLVCQECEYGNNSNSAHPLSFAILRESAAAIVNLSKGLCSRISKVMFLTGSKQLAGSMNMLQNTLRRGVTIVSRFSRPRELARPCAPSRSNRYSARSERAMTGNVLAGKRLNTYIFPSADFWASRVYYLDTYTVNLEFDDDFPVVYDLLYVYIYTYYRSWSSCTWATYPRAILYTLVYFSLNSVVLVIGSHDKYQSLILIGLALTEKASSIIQYIFLPFRSYWRGWRPLVTPLAGHIKEGVEPRDKSEVVHAFSCPGKVLSLLFPSSPVLFLLLLFLLLLLLLLWIFTCRGFLLYMDALLLSKGKSGHFK